MTDYKFYGLMVRYTCPNCGNIIELLKDTVDIFIENDMTYTCEDCDEKINLNLESTTK